MRGRLIALARGPGAKRLSLVASVVALAFFGHALANAFASVDARALISRQWPAFGGAAILYALAYVPMTAAWVVLARTAGARAGARPLAAVFLTSQIAKYLPGNVAQFIGRAFVGHRIGIPLRVTAVALALEGAGVLVAAVLLVGAALSLGFAHDFPAIGNIGIVPLVALLVAAAGALALAAARHEAFRRSSRGFAAATALHMATLALVTCGQLVIAGSLLGDITTAAIGGIAAAVLVGWLIGFAAPGAPAGLGLREVTFVSLLSAGGWDTDALVLTAAAFRLVTVAGDLVAWAVGLRLRGGARLPHRLATS